MARTGSVVAMALGAVVLAAGGIAVGRSTVASPAPAEPVPSATSAAPAATTAPPATTTTIVSTTVTTPRFLDLAGWTEIAQQLPAVTVPSDCPIPFDDPESMPNADRSYRGGVHGGIDFICMEPGHDAIAALPGRVVLANNSFVDATVDDRQALLDEAQALGTTPPWILAFLFGRFVVLDHGIVPGVGHVETIYAHLHEIDPGLHPGASVAAGTRLGEVGNRGTETGANGGTRPQSIHLHWELHVNDVFLGAGLTAEETRTLYEGLLPH